MNTTDDMPGTAAGARATDGLVRLLVTGGVGVLGRPTSKELLSRTH